MFYEHFSLRPSITASVSTSRKRFTDGSSCRSGCCLTELAVAAAAADGGPDDEDETEDNDSRRQTNHRTTLNHTHERN